MSEKQKTIDELTEAGAHLGHKISKLHPRMKDYVVGIRNTIHIIDLEKTEEMLSNALSFISDTIKEGKIIIVGTKPPLKGVVKEIAEDCGVPYVVDRWLGGTFTNFKVISKRISYYKEIKEAKQKGEFDKLSKKEKAVKERHFANLEKKFEGLVNLDKVPDMVFICDIVKNKTVLREAKMKGIKTIAIVDTNADPTLIDYPIIANDDAITSVKYILTKVSEVIKKK